MKFATFLSKKYLEVFTLGQRNSSHRSVFKYPAEGWMSFLKYCYMELNSCIVFC